MKELYDENYSINELVEKSKSDRISDFIVEKLSNKEFPKPAFKNPNRILLKIKEYLKKIEEFKNELKETCDRFNEHSKEMIMLNVLRNKNVENENYAALIERIKFTTNFKSYNTSKSNIRAFLCKILKKIGLYNFIAFVLKQDVKLFDYANISTYTNELDEKAIMNDVKSLDDEENKIEFYKLLMNDIHASLKENVLKQYYESTFKNEIYVDLKFDVNSNNTKNNTKTYRSIKNLSLGSSSTNNVFPVAFF